jgi:precorrin-3B C17-methyltransferase
MTGKLAVVGLGPGDIRQLTPQASDALDAADLLLGYGPYLDRVPERAGQRRQPSDNRQEIDRASLALESAATGASVAVVSGGDPGVFAMAAAVCEALEHGPPAWREVDLAIIPGVTSMLAVSDNLKPWPVIEQRLQAVAQAGLVIALYNPISKARPSQLDRAFEILRLCLPPSTPVVFGRAVGRRDERIRVVSLSEARGLEADMATCIIVGSPETRLVERANNSPLVYTPRSLPAAST